MCPLDVSGQNDPVQFVKYIFDRKKRTSHTLIISNSNFKKSKYLGEGNLDIPKFRPHILRRHCLMHHSGFYLSI